MLPRIFFAASTRRLFLAWGAIGSICSLLRCYLSKSFLDLFYTIPNKSHRNTILHLATSTLLVCQQGRHVTRPSSSSHQGPFLMIFATPKVLNFSPRYLQHSQSGSRISFLEYPIPWNRNGQEVSVQEISPSVCLWKHINMLYVPIYRLLSKQHHQKIILRGREPIVYRIYIPCITGKLTLKQNKNLNEMLALISQICVLLTWNDVFALLITWKMDIIYVFHDKGQCIVREYWVLLRTW